MSSPADELTAIRWQEEADGIVTLVLDAPGSSVNTMNGAFQRSMMDAVTRLERGRGITGVVVTSAKQSFFAGGDLRELVAAGPGDRAAMQARVRELAHLLRRLETLGRPVVAAMNGSALGAGLELALACHHRVLLDDDRVRVGLPEVTLGLMPGAGGVVRTTRLMGLATALTEVLVRGPRLRPRRALELGLVHELAADTDDLTARARAFVLDHPDAERGARQPYDTPGYRVPGGVPASPGLAALLPALPATLVKQMKGSTYPAPRHILAAAVEGLGLDIETALTVENRYFTDLACGQVSTNMIQALWFDLNRVNGGGARPRGRPPSTPPTRVAVLGGGMMGSGIAQVLAAAGLDVVLKDRDLKMATSAKATIAARLETQVARAGSRTATGEVLGRITPAASVADVAGCDAVIEAVFEDEALKRRVFAEIEPLLSENALLASNTSTLPITGLAAGVRRPEAFIGLHFFSPVERMPLVEIVVGSATSDETLTRAYDLVRLIGKTPIVVNDFRGFFTSRVFSTLVLEGAALVGEGMAPMSVERAALQSGFPAGPLTLMDEVTLSLMVRIRDAEVAAGMTRANAHPGMAVLRTLVELGRTGKASGAGFFDWTDGKHPWPGLDGLFGMAPDGMVGTDGFATAQERMLFAMAIEGAQCVDDGVLRSVEDANVGSILGIGFPAMYGGVLQYIDQYADGVTGFVVRARELAAVHGERFHPPALLTGRATVAGSVRAALASPPPE